MSAALSVTRSQNCLSDDTLINKLINLQAVTVSFQLQAEPPSLNFKVVAVNLHFKAISVSFQWQAGTTTLHF